VFFMGRRKKEGSLELPDSKVKYFEALSKLSQRSIVYGDCEKQSPSTLQLIRNIMRMRLLKAGSFVNVFSTTASQLYSLLPREVIYLNGDVDMQELVINDYRGLMLHIEVLKHEFAILTAEKRHEVTTANLTRPFEIGSM